MGRLSMAIVLLGIVGLGIAGLGSCDSGRDAEGDAEPATYALLTVDHRTDQSVDYPEIPDALKTDEVPTVIAVYRAPLGGAGHPLAGYTVLSAGRLEMMDRSVEIEIDLTYTSLLDAQNGQSCTARLEGGYSLEGNTLHFGETAAQLTDRGTLVFEELEVSDCNREGLHRLRGLTFAASEPAAAQAGE